jgi:hypothetical protein
MKIHLRLLTFLQMSPLNLNLTPTPPLPRWVCSTREAVGDLVGDPSDQHQTRSQFQRASSLLAQVSETHDPETFAEASGHPDWDTTMNEEYHSLMENDTWDLVPLPKGRKLVRCKWVYRTKYASDGSVERHKARLVAKGFSQVEGIDYNETFSPVAKMNSIHLVLSLAASHKWEVHQMDVKSTFLHGDLQEEIYMEQPPGYVQNDSSLVCRLKKSLYGLKQAPRAWYAKMDNFLLDTGFSRCHSDPNVYTKKVGSHLIILVLYVDDLILTGSDSKLLNHVKTNLKKKFEMTDLGFLHYFLGLQVLQTKEGIFLSQSKYACDLLRHFHMEDCKPTPSPFQSGVKLVATCTSPEVDATLYRQLVGSLLYLTHTHPDLSFVVGLVSRYMQTPHEIHWKATKRILRYVWGTIQFRYITVQGGLLYWLVSLIQIGSTTLMIESLLQVMFSALVQDLSLGPVRNNRLFLFLQQKQSTEQRLMQVRKPCGFDRSFQSLDSSSNIRPTFGATIRVPSSSPKTQFNINKQTHRATHALHQKAHS